MTSASSEKLDAPNVSSSSSSTENLLSLTTKLSTPITLFPQYTAQEPATLVIREVGLPHFSDSFTVTNKTTEAELFNIKRERPAIGWRQHITDATTNAPVVTLRRNLGQLPVSYRCLDPTNGDKVMDLQGNFFVPFTGSESTATMLNTATGEKAELEMKGSYRNRHARILNKATGETLVEMKSQVLELRNVAGGRRTYEVVVREGMDLVVAVAMIVALDARAD